MSAKITLAAFTFVLGALVAHPTLAQQGRGTMDRLQQQPMTLFDAGMKSLRRLALDSAEKLSVAKGGEVSANVSYKHADPSIEITLHFIIHNNGTTDELQKQCVEYRRDAILKMFRIGLTGYANDLSVNERIRRRIGGQFAPEPTTSMSETISLGEQLGQITYFSVELESKNEPPVKVTCRALASESMTPKSISSQ
jgi:hypothetical protein